MEIKKVHINELIPADYNPRKDLTPEDEEYQKLKRSIDEFGYVEPIVFNEKTNRVVGGHQRLKILKDLNIQEVHVSVVHLNEEKEKALNVALNQVEGEWDHEKLKDLLNELQSSPIDETLTGFSETDIDAMLEEVNIDDFFEETEEEKEQEDEEEESHLDQLEVAKQLLQRVLHECEVNEELEDAIYYFLHGD